MGAERVRHHSLCGGPEMAERFIYLIGAEVGPVKIGYATSLKRRLCSLQTGHPENLTVRFSCATSSEAAPYVEAEVHKRFADKRLRGEWFDVSVDEAAAVIKQSVDKRQARRYAPARNVEAIVARLNKEHDLGEWASEAVQFFIEVQKGERSITRRAEDYVMYNGGQGGWWLFQRVFRRGEALDLALGSTPAERDEMLRRLIKTLRVIVAFYVTMREEMLLRQIEAA